jgi:hypothetical protein
VSSKNVAKLSHCDIDLGGCGIDVEEHESWFLWRVFAVRSQGGSIGSSALHAS